MGNNEPDEYEKRTSDLGLLHYAQEYYRGYDAIKKDCPKDTDCLSVKYYLLCHSLELAMKAWLRCYGLSYLELKSIGHDLEKCMKSLEDKRVVFDPSTKEMIVLVNQYYCNKEFEYFLMGFKSLPEIDSLSKSVHLFISKVNDDVLKQHRQ